MPLGLGLTSGSTEVDAVLLALTGSVDPGVVLLASFVLLLEAIKSELDGDAVWLAPFELLLGTAESESDSRDPRSTSPVCPGSLTEPVELLLRDCKVWLASLRR